MGIFGLAKTYRNIGRLTHILSALARHGFGELLERMNVRQHVRGVHERPREPDEAKLTRDESMARRLRLVMEELGPTFVKLGQMLSQRPDLLPPAYLKELARLREHVKPFPFEEVRRIVERELGGKLEDRFREFEPEPLASGSIAQVHGAILSDGRSAVVKVKRPGIDRVIDADIDLMMQLAHLVEKRVPELAVLRPTMIVEEFGRGIREELDFVSEASLCHRFAAGFEEEDKVLVPEVDWTRTTMGVLTLERIEGVSLSNLEELDRRGVNRKELARHLGRVFVKQFFITGVFHADPHAGNLFICEGDVLGMIDFGLVGRLSDEMKDELAMLLVATVQADIDLIVDVFAEMGVFGDVDQPAELRADLRALLDRYYGMPLKFIDMRKFFLEVMEVARRHHATLPREVVLLGRAFAAVEGLARQLDPEFDVKEVIEPAAKRLLFEKFSPERIFSRGRRALFDVSRMFRSGPRKIGQLVNRILAGRLGFTLEHKGLENFTLEIERASNRLAFAIIVAALLVASSLLVVAKVGTTWHGFPVLGLVGYVIAALMGLWLLVAILRRGRL